MANEERQTVLQQFRLDRLSSHGRLFYGSSVRTAQPPAQRVKPRCYEDVSGSYRCDSVPLWRCVGLSCDPLKNSRVLPERS